MITKTAEIVESCQGSAIVSLRHENPRDLSVLDPMTDKRWWELVKKHPASSVFHSPEWLSALHLAYGYEPIVYTTCSPGSELTSGIVFCKVESWLTGRRLVSLPFSDHCDPLLETSVEFDDLLGLVRRRVADGRWGYCEIRPIRFHPDDSTLLVQSDQYWLHTIDLRASIDNIHRNFHYSVRRTIRRAEREAMVYEEGNSERLLGQFYKLFVSTRRRHHLPPQPLKWFHSLNAVFGAKLKIRVAFKNDTPVASILTLNHKNTVTYKYGCSDARLHRLGGMALLFWTTIQQAKSAGLEKLDLGRTERNNDGLAAFKEHWGATPSNLCYWRYPNCPRSHEILWRKIIVGQIVNAVPDRLLTAMGNLLYRHVG